MQQTGEGQPEGIGNKNATYYDRRR